MRDTSSTGCATCRALPACGGLRDDPDDLFGCFEPCRVVRHLDGRSGCAGGQCDLTCPNNARLFRLRDMEVNGLENTRCGPLLPLPTTRLSPYLPYIRRGLPQHGTLEVARVAVNLYEAVATLRISGTRPRYGELSATAFRRKLHLRDDCEVVLIGVGKDTLVESFWSRFREAGFARLLAPLNILGVTIPNFSFAWDVTRYDHLYSRRRIMLLAEEFSAAGVPVAIHVNAVNWRDWQVWAELLKANPTQRTICQEFETGLAIEAAAEREISRMLWLEQEVGRSLHPILVGGGHIIPLIQRSFKSYSLVTATPYMRAVMRHKAEGWSAHGRPRWTKVVSLPGECLTGLLKHNIDADQQKMFA